MFFSLNLSSSGAVSSRASLRYSRRSPVASAADAAAASVTTATLASFISTRLMVRVISP